MQFTYDAYRDLLKALINHGYEFAFYENWQEKERCVILRHDIDNDIGKALELAKVESEVGVKSTYFVLVTSDFYNVYSARSVNLLHQILECGHEIGLHFDEVRYPKIQTAEEARELIIAESQFLAKVVEVPVKSVSMHRPSKMMLEADLTIPGIINSYGKVFFKDFKYVSDSRKRWREPVEEIVDSEQYNRLHILTHAIWYNNEAIDIHDSIFNFVNAGNRARYISEMENITDLKSIMSEDEINE